jgi:hypothetical protein
MSDGISGCHGGEEVDRALPLRGAVCTYIRLPMAMKTEAIRSCETSVPPAVSNTAAAGLPDDPISMCY